VKRSDNPESVTIGYLLTGVSDDYNARIQAIGRTPVYNGALYRNNCEVSEVGPGMWNADVTWGVKEKNESGEFKWTFTAGGGTRKITEALNYVYYTDSSATPIDHKGSIGVKEDGTVEGVEVPDYKFAWTETHQMLMGSYGWAYANTLAMCVGHTNLYTFRGLGPSTVLLREASGGQSSKDPLLMEVAFTFEHSPDVYGMTMQGITIPKKDGWAYAWARYAPATDSSGNKAQKAVQVDIDLVIEPVDFSLLGI